jgi:AcrR family transcriptional regulator
VNPLPAIAAAKADGRALRSRRTRRAIVTAASELFVSDGYGATSIAAIASRAGVAVQTVYASFGSKRAILATALDQAIAGDDEAVTVNERNWMHDVFHAATVELRLHAYAAAVARIMNTAGDMFMVVATAATADPEVVELATATESRRRLGAASVIEAVLAVGDLRQDLTREEAIDVLWMLNSPAVHHQLVRRAGWTSPRYQAWLAASFDSALLAVETK